MITDDNYCVEYNIITEPRAIGTSSGALFPIVHHGNRETVVQKAAWLYDRCVGSYI